MYCPYFYRLLQGARVLSVLSAPSLRSLQSSPFGSFSTPIALPYPVMRAIGFSTSLPIDDEKSLFEFAAETPAPGPRDLLVRVRAVSVNPVDTKQRLRAAVDTVLDTPRILGYDASGVVEAVGSAVSLFKPGDAVYYAGSAGHWPAIAELIGPQGSIGSILGAPQLDVSQLMGKSVSLAWELMFTRSSFETGDMIEQHRILDRVAGLVDDGRLRTTLSETLHGFTAANHRQAHRMVEAGRMIGKVVITY